jgi:phosphoribosylaminoimidazole carboxylase (NCAIR synthetase)
MARTPITLDRGHTTTVGLIAHDRKLIFRTRQVALKLGVNLHLLAPPRDSDNLGALIASASRCDVITFEPSALLGAHRDILCSAGISLQPGPQAAEMADDPMSARQVLRDCGFDVVSAGADVDASSRPLLSRRELPMSIGSLSVVLARRPSGLRTVYPVAESCGRLSCAHAAVAVVPAGVAESAVCTAISIADGIDATGIVTVNFLVGVDRTPLVNNIVLGLHGTNGPDSTSRLENHLRAILDWPLEATMIDTPLWQTARRPR